MKRFLSLLLLLCGASAFATTAFNVWTPKGNVVTVASAGNQQVLYLTSGCAVVANPCFRMWYVINSTGNVNVLESSDGLTSWTAYSGNPVMTGVAVTTVWSVGGIFYMFASPTPGSFTTIAEWTSTTGLGGWTSIGNVLTIGGSGAWDHTVCAQLNLVDIVSGTWYAYYTGANGPGTNAGGLATSTNGTAWTKAAGQPSIVGLNSSTSAGYNFTKTGTTYYAYGQANYNNAQLSTAGNNFTSIFRWSALSPSGPWTELAIGGVQVPTYYAATAADFVSLAHNNQLGDPNIVVANGNIYLYFDIGTGGSEGAINEAEAIGVTPAQLGAGYEGVVGAPISGATQLNFNTLASDTGAGPNANPIGGPWTTNPFYHAIQRNSNLLEPSSITSGQLAGIAYRNDVTWPNDQWGQLTISASVAATSFAIALRQNTGVQSFYYVSWSGALGSSGTSIIEKLVSGTPTALPGVPTGLTFSVGDTLGAAINGANIYYYYDTILVGVATDSSVASGNAGIYLQGDTVSTSDVAASAWSGGQFQNAPVISSGIGGKATIGGKLSTGQ
jgi:hypothetical protein